MISTFPNARTEAGTVLRKATVSVPSPLFTLPRWVKSRLCQSARVVEKRGVKVRSLAPMWRRKRRTKGCTDLTDLEPLAKMEQLEAVIIPTQYKDIEFLRNHPSLRRLSYKKLTQPVYEFWQEFDGKKDAPVAR